MVIEQRALFRAVSAVVVLTAAGGALAQQAANSDPAKVESGTYKLEPLHTQVGFSVRHMGFSDYSGRLSQASGELKLDPANPSASTLQVSVPVASISTTSSKLDGELVSPQWLDAKAYPTMTFVSKKVTPVDKADARIEGDLTLHGVTKPITLTAHFIGSGTNPLDHKYTAGFLIAGELKRSDFGVKTYVPLIGDTVRLTINAAFEKE